MDRSGGYDEFSFMAECYDHVVPYQQRQDVAFFVTMAQEVNGPVLELGCGTGRVLIPIARTGCTIAGLDASRNMLAHCRARLAAEAPDVQARVRLHEADMRAFDLAQQFALVISPFRPFQHLLTVADQLSCLRCIYRHLEARGRFVLDVFNPSLEILAAEISGQESEPEPEFTLPDGRRVTRRFRVVARDRFNQIQDVEMIYYIQHPGGGQQRLVGRFPMRYLFRFEVEHLLARAGFEVLHLYGDYDRSPFGTRYPGEIIMVAGKANAT